MTIATTTPSLISNIIIETIQKCIVRYEWDETIKCRRLSLEIFVIKVVNINKTVQY